MPSLSQQIIDFFSTLIGKTYRQLTEVEMELARVKKENVELKMERDILKKAAAYFARESLPGTR
jgi:transposase